MNPVLNWFNTQTSERDRQRDGSAYKVAPTLAFILSENLKLYQFNWTNLTKRLKDWCEKHW